MKSEKSAHVDYDMTKEQMEKEIEKFITERNKNIGEEWPLPLGTKWFGQKNKLITKDLIRNYCNSVGDRNPLYRDETYATSTRWGGIIAPPMILNYIALASAGAGLTLPSGSEVGRGDWVRVHGVHGLNIGGSVEWFKPIYPGDEFHCVDKFLRCEEVTKKERPYPRMLRNTGTRKYINQRGEIVAISTGYEMLLIPEEQFKKGEKKIKMGSVFPQLEWHYYTDEELATIDKAIADEAIRGADPRYWEDVNVGDELTPVIKGPLTSTDIAAGMAFRGYAPALETAWILDKSDDVYSNIDPRTGALFGNYRTHMESELAQVFGMARAFATGTQFMEWACHMITNWMGDDGFLKRLDCRFREVMYIGDTTWVKGKVAKKYVENGEPFVDVDVEGINWLGHRLFNGIAKLQLISKKAWS